MNFFETTYDEFESIRNIDSVKKFNVNICKLNQIIHLLDEFHYKGKHIGGDIKFCIGLFYEGNVIGGAIVGSPRHESVYKNCVEIRRMVLHDACPKNSESYFLSKILKYIEHNMKNVHNVLSYADLSVGHKGTIYKASNFEFVGYTSKTIHVFWNGVRYHPRSLSIDRPYSYKLREAIKTGEAIIEKCEPKSIYIYKIKGRRKVYKQDKKELDFFDKE